MLQALRENQHEIATADETRSLLFGTEDTGYLTLTRPAHTAADLRAGDVEPPQEDGRTFGRDYLGGKSVTFEIGVLTDAFNMLDAGDAHRANLDHLDALDGWWLDERLRNSPRAYAMLRSHEGGQTWRAYSRPRRYEEAAGRLTQQGFTPVVCSFDLVDSRFYADEIGQSTAGLAPSPEGGLISPFVFPLTTTIETLGQGAAVVGGNRSTWVWVEFTGPVLTRRWWSAT
jgi:hypothetical protein